jgi:hypothetical protein
MRDWSKSNFISPTGKNTMTLTISITHADEAFPEDLILEIRDEPLTMSYNIRLQLNQDKLNELNDFIESFEQGVNGRYITNGNPPHFPYQVLEFWTNELLLEATSNDNLATGYAHYLGGEHNRWLMNFCGNSL